MPERNLSLHGPTRDDAAPRVRGTPICRECQRPHISVALPWSEGLCTTCGGRGDIPTSTSMAAHRARRRMNEGDA